MLIEVIEGVSLPWLLRRLVLHLLRCGLVVELKERVVCLLLRDWLLSSLLRSVVKAVKLVELLLLLIGLRSHVVADGATVHVVKEVEKLLHTRLLCLLRLSSLVRSAQYVEEVCLRRWLLILMNCTTGRRVKRIEIEVCHWLLVCLSCRTKVTPAHEVHQIEASLCLRLLRLSLQRLLLGLDRRCVELVEDCAVEVVLLVAIVFIFGTGCASFVHRLELVTIHASAHLVCDLVSFGGILAIYYHA